MLRSVIRIDSEALINLHRVDKFTCLLPRAVHNGVERRTDPTFMKRKDVEQMLAAGLITPEQAGAINAHFRLKEGRGWHWLLVCLTALAGGLIVAGIIMLISANWYTIPSLLKMVCAMALLLLCWIGWVKQREQRPLVAEVLGFCGAGVWLGCIALYGQIFQLQNPFIEGFTLFFVGILPLPFICRQRLLIWAVVICSFVQLSLMCLTRDSYLSLVRLYPGGLWEWYLLAGLPLLGGMWWVLAERWRVAGERWSGYYWPAPVLLLAGVSVAQGMMYVPGEFLELDAVVYTEMVLLPLLLLSLKPRGVDWLPWCGVVAVISLVLPCTIGVSYLKELTESCRCDGIMHEPVLPVWVGRLSGIVVYMLLALLMLYCGWRALRLSWINIGTLMVIYAAIALVADVLDSYTFSGLVLVVTGLLMLGLGWLLEKGRRRLVQSVKNAQSSTEL